MPKARGPRTIRSPKAAATIFVCGKCLKRHDDGKAMRRALKEAAKASAAATATKTKVVKTSCFGICPRGGVLVTSPALLTAGKLVLFEDADQVAQAAVQLRANR